MVTGSAHRRGIPAFVLLVVLADVLGRSVVLRVDAALHVAPLAPSAASYYPALLLAVKVLAALGLAALLARATRVHAAATAGRRLLRRAGRDARRPRLNAQLNGRVWIASFGVTSVAYLVQADADGAAGGPWSLFAPWLHTYALPVYAVLSVLVALAWSVRRWLRAVEEFGERAMEQAQRILRAAFRDTPRHNHPDDDHAPRRRFGLAFESRPPPFAA
ncbi:MAG TPA: hypothetical protein VFW85_09335 [Gaiellaceae bacterium]|nr:hypothetical protein [Gaiellaceae bacterium]